MTERQNDGQAENSIPPLTTFAGGIIILSNAFYACCHGNSCAYGLHISFETEYLRLFCEHGMCIC